MFSISGIIDYYTLSENRRDRILGIPDWWFWAVAYAAFCVFVECLLNIGGLLVWEYPWWNRSLAGVWLIFLFGYFHFYVAALLVIGMRKMRSRIITVASLYGISILMNGVGFVLGWHY